MINYFIFNINFEIIGTIFFVNVHWYEIARWLSGRIKMVMSYSKKYSNKKTSIDILGG